MKNLKNYLFTLQQFYGQFKRNYFPEIHEPQVLRKWAGIYSLSNIIAAIFFYLWHLSGSYLPIDSTWTKYLFIISAIIHLSIASRFIKNSQKFNKTSFTKWAWINLIFISPIGLILLYYVLMPKYWVLEDTTSEEEKKILLEERNKENKFQSPKYKKLENKFNSSLAHLRKMNENVTKDILQNILRIQNFVFEELSFLQISIIIALSTVCKQCKQKNFDNLIWGAHWYEDNFFTFGFKNIQPISMHNKYLMTVGSIVLDEMNNYKKILDKKHQIKNNLSFSDAKMISLHMGDECKWYVNQ
ncbi:hypothetical protein [Mycoplasma parvum]|uniref:Uncharacterized protein n=1 Tax=Mycoplasma parvum str. Indiana TaxID=1403316 RepID=U5NDF5_9MOLU|nr:hypothetical protein [Mycoplasma parvum]AGX89335.1 hypothetical protein PRV_03050 [Mycoplasma parvum str. Indiana]